MTCQYVYILVDTAAGTHFYTGCTEDLNAKLRKHNAGEVPHTSKFKPRSLIAAIVLWLGSEHVAAFCGLLLAFFEAVHQDLHVVVVLAFQRIVEAGGEALMVLGQVLDCHVWHVCSSVGCAGGLPSG